MTTVPDHGRASGLGARALAPLGVAMKAIDAPLRAWQRVAGIGGMAGFFLLPNMAIFGVFVLLTGTLVLVIELPPAWAIAAGGLGLITVVLVLVCRLTALNCPFGLGRPTPG